MISFFEPEKIIEQFSFSENLTAADFGCGSGGFTIPLANKLRAGFVYALDIQADPLSALVGNARFFGLNNIKTIKCNLEDPGGSTLHNESIDLVFIINLLFQVENKDAVMREAKRIIKPKGKIIIVDWREDSPFGPDQKRLNIDNIKTMARKLELKFVEEFNAGTYHWGVILER